MSEPALPAGVASERGSPLAQRVGFLLGPALFVLILLLPGLPFDPAQRRTAAIVALVATLWLTVALPVGVTSLLPLVLFPLMGVMPARLAAGVYMNDLVALFLGAFLVALCIERWELHRRMALFVIARVGTRPRRLVLGFMLAAAFLSAWINNTSTTLMMLPIGVAIVGAVSRAGGPGGSGGGRDFAIALLLGMAYASSMGGMLTPIGTAPNLVYLRIFEQSFPEGPTIGFGPWIVAWAPLVVVFVLVGWWLLTHVLLRVDPGGSGAGELVQEERRKLGPMRTPERRVAWVFACTALLWVTRADLDLGRVVLPGWSRLLSHWQVAGTDASAMVTDATVALAMGILCFALPSGAKRGEFLMDWRTASRIPWDVLLLFGGGFCLALGFRESGLDSVLGERLGPLLADLPTWGVVSVIVLSMTFLTEITSNTATTNVMLPLLAQTSVAAGIDPRLTMLPATIAASSAFMLPVATPPNAVVYSSHLVPIPRMARVGLVLNLGTVILVTLVFQLWVAPFLGIGRELPDWARP